MSPATTGRTYERRWWTLAVLSLSLIVISIDNTILNVAIPTLERDLGASASQLQWIVDAYVLVFAGLLLTAGSLADRFGRKRALNAGLLIFGLGSVLAAVSGGATELIASRAVMGVGGALIMPTTLSIITNIFPAGERAKAIGAWAGVSALGIAVGPPAGGWLLEQFSWGAVFLVNIPVVVAALALGWKLVPESRDPEPKRIDVVGAGLSIAALTALLWGIIEAPSEGWTSPAILGAFGVALALGAVFAWWELRVREPMLDVRLFKVRAFAASSSAIALVFFALFGTIYFLTQYLQFVLGYDALETGIRIMPVAGAVMAGAAVSARLAARFGVRAITAAGLAATAAGLAVLATADVTSGYGLVALSQIGIGIGMGLAMTPATDAIMASLPLSQAGVGSAMNDTTRQVGGALGVAILGSLLTSSYGAGMQDATRELPAGAAAAAQDTVGGALHIAGEIGGAPAGALTEAAHAAFVSGMTTTALVAAGVALAGALIAALFLPRRVTEHASRRVGPAVAEGARA